LNSTLIAKKQPTDEQLAETLTKNEQKYTATMKEGVKLYINHKTEAIYVPASLRTPILQWYHTNL
jgi:hypothetical protein